MSYVKGVQDICLRWDQLITKQCTVGDHKTYLACQAYVWVFGFFILFIYFLNK